MERLNSLDGLIVRQQKEWVEILSGFETKNKYTVLDEAGNNIYYAAEEGGSALLRVFLKALRPFTIVVLAENNQEVLRVARPFRFYFHEANILDSQGQSLGALKKRFSFFRRKYSVLDSSGRELFQLFGPILKPWTFVIKKGDAEYGKITKKWSGLLKEGFTDADNFDVTFPREWDARLKALFLGAVFLIDFVHFENKGND
ncbi:phospholipid scramblase-related protein [Gallaecimonas kandeliae]|uniref:phospholipid scramblase-related protein n=1 Tax=Gallaecimonas kandeliae TaxID=3029055 RepID=UPI002649B8A4|nr:phospholipid scramblase-related protein [Gallaecimonas kandeliae]WKE66988.1 phospholipid scramblase-related protein [Gallaecimonas kandeliae]